MKNILAFVTVLTLAVSALAGHSLNEVAIEAFKADEKVKKAYFDADNYPGNPKLENIEVINIGGFNNEGNQEDSRELLVVQHVSLNAGRWSGTESVSAVVRLVGKRNIFRAISVKLNER